MSATLFISMTLGTMNPTLERAEAAVADDSPRATTHDARRGEPISWSPGIGGLAQTWVLLAIGAIGPACGDGVVNDPSEECDPPDTAACPGGPVGMGVGFCQANCKCCGGATPTGPVLLATVAGCLTAGTCNPTCDVNGDGCCTYADLEAALCLFTAASGCCGPTPVPPPPTAIAGKLNKVRSIAFTPATTMNRFYAIRVRFVSLHSVSPPYAGCPSIPFTAFEGLFQWVGPPATFFNCAGEPYYAAYLQCDPYYSAWTGIGALEVLGEAIVPSSEYEVETVGADDCGGPGPASAPLVLTTNRWGDVAIPFSPPATTTQPNFTDISTMVDYFSCIIASPQATRFHLVPGLIDLATPMGFADIAACVDAFKGLCYPFNPGYCLGASMTTCRTDAGCAAMGPCVICP